MSEKWYREAHLLVDSERNVLANCGSTKRARQILRELNAHDALVEALRRILSLGITHHTEKEARAALKLTEGGDDE